MTNSDEPQIHDGLRTLATSVISDCLDDIGFRAVTVACEGVGNVPMEPYDFRGEIETVSG
jgi:hypothetical protein